MIKLIAFDLDGTLTQHRTLINDDNLKLLGQLKEKYHLVMVGAGDSKRIYEQLRHFNIDILGNYGMQESTTINNQFKLIREDKVEVDKDFFIKNIEYLREKYGYTNYKGESIEFHESGMITFPLLGKNADIKDKIVFDPDRNKRRVLYPEVLEIFENYSVYIGGSSSFDFTRKEYNKYDALMKYASKFNYKKDEILYIGDDFDDGGGDSHIRINNMKYIKIEDYLKIKIS